MRSVQDISRITLGVSQADLVLYDANCIDALTQITSGTTTTYKIAKRNLEPEKRH
jgi:hypothetical protein